MSLTKPQHQYTEVVFQTVSEEEADLLTALMLDLGFEGFSLEGGSFSAFIGAGEYDECRLEETVRKGPFVSAPAFRTRPLQDRNWNEEWEKSYEPVVVAGRCLIRAPFHQPVEGIEFDLVIEPKMSFGTAHHETTSLMIGWLLDEDVRRKRVLDMGCGTGVLAILAARMGAGEVVAIDPDEWAFRNAKENCERNNETRITVIRGDAGDIPARHFDLILANINRNVLLEQIPGYARVMACGGGLFLSGFYEEDLEAILRAAESSGFRHAGSRSQNRWMAVKFTR